MKIIQIVPAAPGWHVHIPLGMKDLTHRAEIACWGLTDDGTVHPLVADADSRYGDLSIAGNMRGRDTDNQEEVSVYAPAESYDYCVRRCSVEDKLEEPYPDWECINISNGLALWRGRT
jgi:hypothetical protein